METIIGEVDMNLTEIHKTIIPDIPHWTINLTLAGAVEYTYCTSAEG